MANNGTSTWGGAKVLLTMIAITAVMGGGWYYLDEPSFNQVMGIETADLSATEVTAIAPAAGDATLVQTSPNATGGGAASDGAMNGGAGVDSMQAAETSVPPIMDETNNGSMDNPGTTSTGLPADNPTSSAPMASDPYASTGDTAAAPVSPVAPPPAAGSQPPPSGIVTPPLDAANTPPGTPPGLTTSPHGGVSQPGRNSGNTR